jgi:ABC-type multidrug transport system ATPase subunit
MIQANRLTKRYGRHTILESIDLEIGDGERVAVLGSNGAGKTTLLKCMLGLVDFEGRLTIDGLDVKSSGRAARQRLAYVTQMPPIFDLSLSAFLELFGAIRDVDPASVASRLSDLGLALDIYGDKPMRQLSGGMLQKGYLALALAADSAVLLLDEPTAGLDPGSRREFIEHLSDVNGDRCMVLATHRLEEAESIAERLIILHRGGIVFDGPLGDSNGTDAGGGIGGSELEQVVKRFLTVADQPGGGQ